MTSTSQTRSNGASLGDIPLQYQAALMSLVGQTIPLRLGEVAPTFGGSDSRTIRTAAGAQLMLVRQDPSESEQTGFTYIGIVPPAALKIDRQVSGRPH